MKRFSIFLLCLLLTYGLSGSGMLENYTATVLPSGTYGSFHSSKSVSTKVRSSNSRTKSRTKRSASSRVSAKKVRKGSAIHNAAGRKKVSATTKPGIPRDKNGRIKRSSSEKKAFMKQTGYPHGRPGYVVDHIVPLKKGGCDCPANMQWQTVKDAKAKDKWE